MPRGGKAKKITYEEDVKKREYISKLFDNIAGLNETKTRMEKDLAKHHRIYDKLVDDIEFLMGVSDEDVSAELEIYEKELADLAAYIQEGETILEQTNDAIGNMLWKYRHSEYYEPESIE